VSAFARLKRARKNDTDKISADLTRKIHAENVMMGGETDTSSSIHEIQSNNKINIKRQKVNCENTNDDEILQIVEDEDGVKSAIELGLINGMVDKSSDTNDTENSDTNDSTDNSSDSSEDDNNDKNSDNRFKTSAESLSIDFGMGAKTLLSNSKRGYIDVDVTTSSTVDPEGINYYNNNIVVGLRAGDCLMIKGKFKLIVQKGAITLNTIVFHADERHVLEVEASSLSSLPVIRPTSAQNPQLVNNSQNKWNANFFSPKYMSVVKIENWFDGSNEIGMLYSQLKNIYCTKDDVNVKNDMHSNPYSFRPIKSSSEGEIGTTELEDWRYYRNVLTSEIQEAHLSKKPTPHNILLLGGKNSGKSTFLRILLNHMVRKADLINVQQVAVLDIDPGQTEFSDPGCISVTIHRKPAFGSINSLKELSQKSEMPVPDIQEFVGFTSPQVQPQSFFRKLKRLIDKLPADCPVLVNTPGWIKGFGVQIFEELTRMMHITHLVLFTNSERPENDQYLLEGLQYDYLIRLQGFHLPSSVHTMKYSSSQIRNFKILSYFHYSIHTHHYDFTPLLSESPYRIPYSSLECGTQKPLAFISLLDGNSNVNAEDVDDFLVFQVVGMFTVTKSHFSDLVSSLTDSTRKNGRLIQAKGLPNIAVECSQLLEGADMKYHGLALIHSIDRRSKSVNIYTPIDLSHISELVTEQDEKLVFVKGGLKYPVQEIFPEAMYREGDIDCSRIESGWIPYLSFNRDVGKGGKAVNARHNIQRRNLKG